MNPIISIIVPVYNVEEYLQRCIDSILNQRFKDFELILINDGSTDNSLKICKEYSLSDSRVKVINKENGGLSSARNAGINIAKGKYIGFVDSDDWINEEMYQTLYNLLQEYDCDIAECCYKKVYDEKIIEKQKKRYEISILSNIKILESMYVNNFAGSTISVNKLYKSSLFKNIRFPEGKLNEDQFTTYKIYFNSRKVVSINREMYYYYQSGNSITRSEFSIKKLDAIEAIESSKRFFEENNLYDLVLWNDTLYSFVLIKYYFILESNGKEFNEIKNKLKIKFNDNYKSFINNPYIGKKSKFLLIMFNISPKLYKIMREVCAVYNGRDKYNSTGI